MVVLLQRSGPSGTRVFGFGERGRGSSSWSFVDADPLRVVKEATYCSFVKDPSSGQRKVNVLFQKRGECVCR